MAVEIRELRPAAAEQHGGDAADGRRRALHDAGFRPNVVAIDAATGETLWNYRFDEGARGDRAPRSVSRGVEYWTDGKQARIILVTRGYQLVSLDAKTGMPDPAFGKNGVVDLYQDFDQPPPGDGVISSTSPAVVVRNVIVFGAAMVGGTAPRSKENTKGYIRGFDVRTGKRLWTFHTIPQPGEFGNDTWLNDSWSYTGNTTVWSPFSADEELGYVYLPVETADGRLLRRPPSRQQPVRRQPRLPRRQNRQARLASAARASRHLGLRPGVSAEPDQHHRQRQADPRRRAGDQVGVPVRVRSRQRHAGMADRRIGRSKRARCPANGTRRRSRIRRNPRPTIARASRKQDLIDFTPELNAEARAMLKEYKIGPLYTPPIVAGEGGLRGTLQIPAAQGAALWQGAAWDPETNMLYVPSVTNMTAVALQPGGDRSDMNFIGGGGGGGGGRGAAPQAARRRTDRNRS